MAPQNVDQGSQHIDMNVVPEVCRSECYRAYEETQRHRKTPELCRTDSVFTKDYAACRTCILHQGTEGDDWTNANKFYLQPAFGEYVEYCNSMPIQSAARTSSTSSRAAVTMVVSSDISTQIVPTFFMTGRPRETASSILTTTITTTSALAPSPETISTQITTATSSVVKSPVSSSPPTQPSRPSETATPPPLPGPPSISLTTTVIIIIIPVCSAILLTAGLVYLYFCLRKRRKQSREALINESKDGSALSKASTWEKGEMSARISTLPRQEMEDWRGVGDMGPHELPVGGPALEIMDVGNVTDSDTCTTEQDMTVADSPTLSGREMVEGAPLTDSHTLSTLVGDATPAATGDADERMNGQ